MIEAIQKSIASEDQDMEQSQRMVDQLMQLLFERMHDINSFTRSMVCKTLSHLVEIRAVRIERYVALMELAYDRLSDKTAVVRKSTMQLLAQLIDFNPFSPCLTMGYYDERKREVEAGLNNHQNRLFEWFKANCPTDEREVLMEKAADEQFDHFLTRPLYIDDEDTKLFLKQAHFIGQGIVFIEFCHKTVSKIATLLKSKINTDVLESLDFLTRAINFSVTDSAKNFQK